MKQNKEHPAIAAAATKARTRYIIFAFSLLLCVIIFALGFVFKPKASSLEATDFNQKTPVDTYSKVDLLITSAMFEQDDLDEDNKVIGTVYYALAIDSDMNKFMIRAPKEYYEENIKKLEDNSAVNIDDNSVEVLDENNKVTVYGYSREMSANLKEALSSTDNEYNKSILSVVYPNIFEVVKEPVTVTKFNTFYVAGGFATIIALIILMTAVSASAQLSRAKEKYEEKAAKTKKKK